MQPGKVRDYNIACLPLICHDSATITFVVDGQAEFMVREAPDQ